MKQKIARRVNVIYAAMQGSYWLTNMTLTGYVAIFLSGRGLSDTQSGLTISLAALGSILLQTFVSDYSDRHPRVPLKRIISLFYIAALIAAAGLLWIPSSVALVMILYICGASLINALIGFLNAVSMQLFNIGLPINFGIPRGIGSLCAALSGLILGNVVETSGAEIVLPIFLCFCVLAIVCTLILPRPDSVAARLQLPVASTEQPVVPSTWKMLKTNKVFDLLLIAIIFTFTGQAIFSSFLIRAVENVGGNAADLGVCYVINSGCEIPALFLSGLLLKKFSSRGILTVSFFAFFLRSLLLAVAPSMPLIYLSCALSIGGLGLFSFASVYFVNDLVAPTEKVRGQALASLCGLGGISNIIGASLGGVVIDQLGVNALLYLFAGFSLIGFLLMGIVASLQNKQHIAISLKS